MIKQEVLARERALRKLISPFSIDLCTDFYVFPSLLQPQLARHGRSLVYREGDVVQDYCRLCVPWEEHRVPGVQRAGQVPKMPEAEERGMGSMLGLSVWGRRWGIESRGGGERDEEVGGGGDSSVMSATRSDEVCDLQFCDRNLSLKTAKNNIDKSYDI